MAVNAPASTGAPVAAETATAERRNPGPSWGYRLLRLLDRVVPEAIYRPMRAMGTWFALFGMPAQRRCSREYLRVVLGREPRRREVFRHFFAFEETLMLKLRVDDGRSHACELGPDAGAFGAWLAQGFPVLLGTFHVGVSDLLGFLLGGHEHRRVYLVRQRVGNSHDTERLGERFGEWVRFVWVNDPSDMVFALKDAAATGEAIAMKCDRVEFSSRTEAFEFLGARRVFPFTIYHLALVFGRPVILSFGVPVEGENRSVLHASPIFALRPGESRPAALARAREHFQDFLRALEAVLRRSPYLWFNFVPLPPVAPSSTATAASEAENPRRASDRAPQPLARAN